MMQQVTHIPRAEPGASADLFVRQIFIKLQPDHFPAAIVQCLKTETHQTNPFQTDDLFVRHGLRVGRFGSRGSTLFGWQLEGDYFAGIANVVQREIMHRSIEPSLWLTNVVKLCVQSHECFLDDVLGDTELADQAESVCQERRFEGGKELLNRFASGRLGAGLVWLHHGHAGIRSEQVEAAKFCCGTNKKSATAHASVSDHPN